MPRRRYGRYAMVRQNITRKYPDMTEEDLHACTKYVLARDSKYGNWHHLPDIPGGWVFPIDENLSVRLEPGSLQSSFYVSLVDKHYYNPSADPETHLAFLTYMKTKDAKMEAIRLAADHICQNTLHFQQAWDKLQGIAKRKSQPYCDIITKCLSENEGDEHAE